jgi:acyl-coenzyme A thioesterase 13
MDIPAGFQPMDQLRTSPFLDRVGPFFFQRQDRNLVLGVRVGETHANARGTAHGGLLLTMADVALGYQLAFSQDPPVAATTVSMSADFLGAASLGDWVEAHVEMQQLGARMAFANAYLAAGEKRVARVSASFLRGEGSLPPARGTRG